MYLCQMFYNNKSIFYHFLISSIMYHTAICNEVKIIMFKNENMKIIPTHLVFLRTTVAKLTVGNNSLPQIKRFLEKRAGYSMDI